MIRPIDFHSQLISQSVPEIHQPFLQCHIRHSGRQFLELGHILLHTPPVCVLLELQQLISDVLRFPERLELSRQSALEPRPAAVIVIYSSEARQWVETLNWIGPTGQDCDWLGGAG